MSKKKHAASTAMTASVKAALSQAGFAASDLFDGATKVAFHRALSEAQVDEAERLEAIRASEIDPYYSLVNIANAKVSAQFLNPGEEVETENRETMLQVRYDDIDVDVVMATQDGQPLGLLITMEDSEVFIAALDYDGYKLLLVTLPEYDVVEVHAFDSSIGRYVFVLTEPLPQVAKAA